jgi:hypothetical protein
MVARVAPSVRLRFRPLRADLTILDDAEPRPLRESGFRPTGQGIIAFGHSLQCFPRERVLHLLRDGAQFLGFEPPESALAKCFHGVATSIALKVHHVAARRRPGGASDAELGDDLLGRDCGAPAASLFSGTGSWRKLGRPHLIAAQRSGKIPFPAPR